MNFRNENNIPVISAAIALMIATIFLFCTIELVEPEYIILTDPTPVQFEASCVDSTFPLFITAINYTIDTPIVAWIRDYVTGISSDTFFANGQLVNDEGAYMALASRMGISQDDVCEATFYNPVTLDLSMSGHIGVDSFNGTYHILIRKLNHPGIYALGIFSYVP